MTSSWLKIVLIISLGLNCMIGGALAYRFVWGRPLGQFFGCPPPWHRNPLFSSLPPESRTAHEQLREKMMAGRRYIAETRDSLMEALSVPDPDRKRIDEQLDAINKQQAAMERMAVEQMLLDIQSLPPEKRAAFIQDIRQSRYCRWPDGPGMGRGWEGRGGRHGPKHFEP
jgi:hypothetical protein